MEPVMIKKAPPAKKASAKKAGATKRSAVKATSAKRNSLDVLRLFVKTYQDL
jgi:hypothetical protein